jgi:hypothetical protein
MLRNSASIIIIQNMSTGIDLDVPECSVVALGKTVRTNWTMEMHEKARDRATASNEESGYTGGSKSCALFTV